MQTQKNVKPHLTKTIYVHLTHACNLHCIYCYFDAGEALESELSLDELRLLFKEIVSLAPQKVVLTGGEPLLRSDLFDIAHAFREVDPDKQVCLCLISNGTLIEKQNVSLIAQTFDEVRISLDGPREVNDRLRGNGTFDGAVKAIHNLHSAGTYPGVSITVTTENVPHLSGFLSFLLREGVTTEFHLAPFRPVGRGALYLDLACSPREARLAVADFWQRHFGIQSGFAEAADTVNLASCGNCGVGSYINILPDGSVYPCHVLSVPKFLLGNVRQTKLSTIIQESTLLKNLRNIDFTQLKGGSDRLKQLLTNAICLGEVYRDATEEVCRFLNNKS